MKDITWTSEIDLVDNGTIKYDNETHRYILTIEGTNKKTGDNPVLAIGSNESANAYLELISELTYAYMYNQIDKGDRPILEFRISRDTDLAIAIQQAMINFYRADRITGATKIYFQHGLDTGLAREDIEASVVPPIVNDILDNATLLVTRYHLKVPSDIYRKGY